MSKLFPREDKWESFIWWRVADDGGFLSWCPAKSNSKRSTILQHLLADPHQQMLQNSSALEIKAVWWGGDAKDEGSLQGGWHYKQDAAWSLLNMWEKKNGGNALFSDSFHTNITFSLSPLKKKARNNPNASVIALSQRWQSVSFHCTLCLWWRAVSLFVLHAEWNPFPAEECYNSAFFCSCNTKSFKTKEEKLLINM